MYSARTAIWLLWLSRMRYLDKFYLTHFLRLLFQPALGSNRTKMAQQWQSGGMGRERKWETIKMLCVLDERIRL